MTTGVSTDELSALIATAATTPTPDTIGQILEQLGHRRGQPGFQKLLYELHYGPDEPTHALRQWLASTCYPDLAAAVGEIEPLPSMSQVEFVEELARQQRAYSPLHHPLLQHCYSDASSFADLQVYLRHKWIIMLTFWRSLSEFGARLQRHDLSSTALVYKNVDEELGSGDIDQAHLVKHHRLLQGIGLDVSWGDEPEYEETYGYINFRMFCMRHPEPAWGLGSFYSQEATSLEYTIGHYDQLRRHGVSHDLAEIYYSHEEIDTEHTDEVVTIINALATTPAQRAIVLAAQRHQLGLWNAHFDRVLAEIVDGPAS